LTVSDRMASVGTLAAGVAHEINNPLAALMANVDFSAHLVSKLAQEARAQTSEVEGKVTTGVWRSMQLSELEESLRDAKECADRVRNIVRDLKIFSRSEEDKTNAVDVRSILESSLRMAWNEIRHRARLVKEYSNVPPVEGNEGRLGQVFLNLIMNAAQAIPEGQAHKNEIRVITKQNNHGQVVIEIHDTGPGIPENIISRIFDPFFTTKPIGEGTGLGLAICHRIVTSLGGQLTVESQVGKGTVFRAILPIAKSDIVELLPKSCVVLPDKRGRLLIVDDEVSLGKVLKRALSQEHEVIVVTNARDALKLVSQGDSFDVIFCDLMMPEMTGMDLYTELLQLAPKQAEKMIFMTGGVFTNRARAFLEQVQNPRLEKPFDMSNLKALVYTMLR
jgi:nitrogen-specific signal transduction histidine kinase